MVLPPDPDSLAQAQRWRLHIEQTPLAVIEWDLEGRVRAWNSAAERMFGYVAAEAIGQPIIELIVPPKAEIRDQVHHIAEGLTQDGLPSRVEHENRRKDGSIILCRWFNTPLTDGTSQPLGVASMALDVTEIQRANESLKENEQRFRTVADFTYDWEYWIASDGSIRWMSPSCERVTGYSVEAFLADPELIYRIAHPEDRDKLADHVHESTGSQGLAPMEFRIKHREGQQVWISHICFPVLDTLGNPAGRRVSNRDITEKKQFELALQESERRARTIFEKATDGIILFNLEGKILDVNEALAHMHGRSREEMQGLNIRELNTPETNALVPRRIASLLAGETLKAELSEVHKDGHVFAAEATASQVYLAGQPAILSFHRDITERKRIEQALRQEKRMSEHYLDVAESIIMVLDTEVRLTRVNRKGCSVLGYEEGELLGRDWTKVYLPPEERDSVLAVFQHLASGALETDKYHENYILRKDGERRLIAWHNSELRDEAGKFIGFLSSGEDITERRQSEMALRASEARFHAIWDAEPECLKLVSPEGILLDMNPAGLEMLEVEAKEQAIGHPVVGMVLPEYRARFLEMARCAYEEGFGQGEFEIASRKGTHRWMESRAVPLRDEESQATLLLAVTRDITERKRAEAALVESEERLRLALDATSDGLWDWHVPTGKTYYSPTYTRMLGYELDEYETEITSWSSLIHPEDRARVLAANEACIQGACDSFEVEFRMRTRSGQTKWIRGRGKATSRDAQGRALRLLGTHQDVTEKKLAEQMLRASEERFRALVQDSWDILSILDARGRLIYNSPACERIHGFTVEELLGRSTIDLIHPEDAPRVADEMLWVLAHPGVPCMVEYRYACKDGHWVWMEAVGVNHLDNPAILGIVVSSRDISERKQAESDRANLEAQLQQAQKMESLGTLSGGVAHDMNNVLGAILGLASANLEIQPAGSPTYRAFETIVKAATRGGEMVRSLLSFARQGRAESNELDLNTILREEVHLLERTTLSRVRLEMDLEPGLRLMRGDAGALMHAIMNVCVNAVDAMPDQGKLTLRTRNLENDWIEVLVEDTGTGMPKEVLERALDPFFTTKEVGKGTGLGLAMVYTTVKAHQGQLELQSEPGRGTRVRLRFPACKPATQVREPGEGAQSKGTARSQTVLLVDDDALIQDSTRALLEALGHAVFTASSGEEALLAIEAGLEPEVVILDMNMPGLGGSGTLPRLHALLPEVPVLLSTGRTDQAALELAAAHPHVTLLPKPFSLKDLKQGLEGVGRPG